MFGLPNRHPLSEVVLELTQDHLRIAGENQGTEPPLLRLLELAIKADTSGAGGGSGRNKNSAPLDVGALALWEEIARVIGNHWPGRGDLTLTTTHLIDRLIWWTNSIAGTDNEGHLLEFCLYWRDEIRFLLEPKHLHPAVARIMDMCTHERFIPDCQACGFRKAAAEQYFKQMELLAAQD